MNKGQGEQCSRISHLLALRSNSSPKMGRARGSTGVRSGKDSIKLEEAERMQGEIKPRCTFQPINLRYLEQGFLFEAVQREMFAPQRMSVT